MNAGNWVLDNSSLQDTIIVWVHSNYFNLKRVNHYNSIYLALI
jgi:hypothetical protein